MRAQLALRRDSHDLGQHAVTSAPEIFLFLAVAIGTVLGRIRIRGFAIGATACTLIVAVVLGQLGTFVIPPMLKSIFFGLFVFTIGYRSGPEFFASLSFRTLAQVALALVMGACGLVAILVFAYMLHLDPGTAAGLGAGSLTQTSMMGTASGALEQLAVPADRLKQEQANIAAGYAVTYVCGYILVLLFVPLVAPRLMGVNLKEEATKLEAALSGGAPAEAGQSPLPEIPGARVPGFDGCRPDGGRDRGPDRPARRRRAHPPRRRRCGAARRYETAGRRRDSARRAVGGDRCGGAA